MAPPWVLRLSSLSIRRAAVCATKKAAFTFRLSNVSRLCSFTSKNGSGMFVPALLIKMSSLGRLLMAACISSVFVTSQTRGEASRPRALISPVILSSSSTDRLRATISAPASANPNASVRPIPRPAPVTRAVRPSRLKLGKADSLTTLPPVFYCVITIVR